MSRFTDALILVAAVIVVLPVAMNPAAWPVVLFALGVLLVGRWAIREGLDWKKHKDMGRESPIPSHQLVRDTDDIGNRGNDNESGDDSGWLRR